MNDQPIECLENEVTNSYSPSGSGPIADTATSLSRNPFVRRRPEPSVDDVRLKILPITSFEVTLPAAGPDVRDVLLADETLEVVVLSLGIERDGVHAELAAIITGFFPTELGVQTQLVPRQVIPLAELLNMDGA